MYTSSADIIALFVVLALATAMIFFGDPRFGVSVMIGSILVFLFYRRRKKRRSDW